MLLLPYAETLLITNSTHESFSSNWLNYAVECMILTSHHLPVQTHQDNFRPALSIFFDAFQEIQSKLHNIVLILLQWIWAMSVDVKSFCN